MANIIVRERSDKIKSIDPGDWISGIIEWIDDRFKNRNVFISKKGFTSLYLGLYTFVLLYFLCQIKSLTDIRYIASYGPIFYFMLELFSKFHKSKYDLEQINKSTITHYEIGLIIEKQSTKNPDGVIQEIDKLKSEGNFEEDLQFSLLKKYDEYPMKLKKYVDDLTLTFILSPAAICYFVSLTSFQEDYIKKLNDKYGNHESFLFSLGRFQYYNFEDDQLGKKYYNAGYKYKKSRYFVFVLILIGLVLFIPSLSFFIEHYETMLTGEHLNLSDKFGLSMVFAGVYLIIFNKIHNAAKILLIKSKLKKSNIYLEGFLFDKFTDEIDWWI